MMEKRLSYLKDRFFPDFYQYDAPRFIEFFKVYLEWLEEPGNIYYNVSNLKNYTDIDNSVDEFLKYLQHEYLAEFPEEFSANTKYLMHNVLLLYQSKGNIYSFRFLFRALYDSFCRISYPRDFILKSSDGKWVEGYYLYTEDILPADMHKYTNMYIKGLESGATAIINTYLPFKFDESEEYVYCFSVTDSINRFKDGEEVVIVDSDPEIKFVLKQSTMSTGYWSNTDGFLNADKVLQDSYYYQNFSYEITSLVPLEVFRDIVKKVVHPAGFRMFSNVVLTDIEKEPYAKTPVTFIRWFIIKILIELEAISIQASIQMKLKYKSFDAFSDFFTPDAQIYNKLYGSIESFAFLTPEQLETWTNRSSTILFDTNGKRIDHDFIDNNINEYAYYAFYFENNIPFIRFIPENNSFSYPWIKNASIVWVFDPNGYKIDDRFITINNDTIIIEKEIISGNYCLYSLDPYYVDCYNKYSMNIDETTKLNIVSDKIKVIPFVDGRMSFDKLNNDNTISASGWMDLYQFKPYQDVYIEKIVNTNYDLKYHTKRRIKYV